MSAAQRSIALATDAMAKSFELMDLEPHEQRLIERISPEADRFYLSPLDKGLSGARTLIVRWSIDGHLRSAQHVAKIGDAAKIAREYEAVQRIRPLLPRLGAMRVLPRLQEEATHRLLLQEYGGGETAVPLSLRQWLGNFAPGVAPSVSPTIAAATRMMERLYKNALREVHFQPIENYRLRHQKFSEALDWWVSKGSLLGSSVELDLRLLAPRLQAKGFPEPVEILKLLENLSGSESSFSYGFVHGDLHTQNVLVDESEAAFLIDFAWAERKWRAVDFLMMECSLKFVCAPFDAEVDDLCELEALLDAEVTSDDLALWAENTPFGREIAPAAAGVAVVRRLALDSGAVADFTQYRRGLAILTSALATRPGLNRLYLLYSLAHQVRELLR